MGLSKFSFYNLLAIGALTGCVPAEKIEQPPLTVKATSAAKARVVGNSSLVLRTYVLDDARKRKEVTGANCRFKSADIAGSATSPRVLVVPAYAQGARFKNRGAPAPLRVDCQRGDMKGAIILEPVPLGTPSRQQTSTTTVSGGATITSTTTPLTSRMASAYPWSYGIEASVVLR